MMRSRTSAPPWPLMRSRLGATSSAPSTVMSSSSSSDSGASGIPASRASSAVAPEGGTRGTRSPLRTRAPSNRTNTDAVRPDPSPTSAPSATSSSARAAAASMAGSSSPGRTSSGLIDERPSTDDRRARSSRLPEHAIHRARNHHFLVGTNDPNGDAPGGHRNYRLVPAIRLRIELDAEESKPFADARADRRRILANSTGEYECVEPAERGGERADPFLRLVTEERDRLRRAHVGRL